jgi:DNA-binding transcriptional MerR regulator
MTLPPGSQTFTPAEAAHEVGVGSQTIRRWCEWHAEHLSPGANPPAGAPRRLNWRDIEVFKSVRVMRDEGLPTSTINERLESMAFPTIDTESPAEGEALTIPPSEDLQDTSKASIVVMETLTTVLRELETVRSEQKEMRRYQRDYVLVFGAGVIVAALFFLVILLLANLGQ